MVEQLRDCDAGIRFASPRAGHLLYAIPDSALAAMTMAVRSRIAVKGARGAAAAEKMA